MTDHRPPFLVDYEHDGRRYCFTLEAPADWAEAEAHLRSIRLRSWVEGGDVLTVRSNVVTLWIDGLAVWLKCAWRNWRRR